MGGRLPQRAGQGVLQREGEYGLSALRALYFCHEVVDNPGGSAPGSVSKVEMATPIDLIYKVLFSIYIHV